MGEKVQRAELQVERIRGGYMILVGDTREPLIGEPGSDGFLEECNRVGEALGVRGAEILTVVQACLSDEVEAILNDPRPLDRVGETLDDAIAGEDNNKRLLFVLLLSGLTMDPDLNEMILFKSSAGGGKSFLANFLTKYYKTKKIGRFSKTALDYTDLKNYQVLYLMELGQMDSEEYGVSTVKFLSSEDGGYNIEITVRDKETGAMTTMQRKIPPLTVISSTARVFIDGQFERRNWILSVDETPEQTEKIRKLNARHELENVELQVGLRKETSGDRAERLLRALVEAIMPCAVSILFPDTLMSVLRSQRLRIRGDYKKIMRLMRYYSWLKQRTITSLEVNGKLILFPTPRDAMEILEIAIQPLIFMTQDIEGRDLKLLAGMDAMKIIRKGDLITPALRDELRLNLGYSKNTIRQYLAHLVDRGFLTDDDKRPKTYTLVNSLAKIKQEISSVSDVIENRETFILKMTQEATKNLEDLIERKPELAELRPAFIYEPKGISGEVFNDSDSSPDNRYKPKITPNQPHSDVLTMENAQNANVKKTPTGTPSLKDQMDQVLNVIWKMEQISGSVRDDDLYDELEKNHGLLRAAAARVVGVLMKDGTIYSPRPGYYKGTS